jgi:outer membrane protein OmpA-like peptidoglycan-associated protein/tetratricopeptide (TPR) repeat protein
MKNLKTFGLLLFLAFMVTVNSFAQTLRDAEVEFNRLSYLNATEMFEHALKGKLSDADKQAAMLKLAYSYRQIKDSQNAERVYAEVLNSGKEIAGDASKAYLYYAQSLASNGKYKEAQDIYEKYSKLVSGDTRGAGFQQLYKKVDALNKNAACYKVDYLNINTDKPDFSPMYYKNGLVFNSGRVEGPNVTKKVFAWDNSHFLDMYYLKDLASLTTANPSVGAGSSTENKAVKKLEFGTVGTDEYTPPTANDSKTLGNYGGTSNQYRGYTSYVEEAATKSLSFSGSLNTKYHEGPMTFSSDGKKVIFTRNNYNNGTYKTSADKVNKLKLYTAEEKKDGEWVNIKEVPFNNNEYSTGHPSLTKDEKLLYFVSDMPGGFGGTDIYVVSYNGGAFGTPLNLGAGVNTAGNEMFPYVDEKGNLYFSSDGHPGLGDLDIFYVKLGEGSKVIGNPTNLGTPINTNKDDFGLITDGDRKMGYFSSNRKRGGADDDIYRFTRECEEKPECHELQVIVYDAESKMPLDNSDVEVVVEGKSEMKKTDANGTFKICLQSEMEYTFKASHDEYEPNTVGFAVKTETRDQTTLDIPLQRVKNSPIDTTVNKVVNKDLPCPVKKTIKGRVTANKDKRSLAGVIVTLKNECDGSTQTFVTGPDGRSQFEICEGCDYSIEASKENYGSKENKITTKNSKLPPVINSNVSMFEAGDVVNIDNIYYDYTKYNIRPDAARELEKLVSIMKRYPKMRIELHSHTDSRATTEFNQTLSENRAKSVIRYLAQRGISSDRLEWKGFGETQLLNECADGVTCTEEQHQVNRRTEFKILQLK